MSMLVTFGKSVGLLAKLEAERPVPRNQVRQRRDLGAPWDHLWLVCLGEHPWDPLLCPVIYGLRDQRRWANPAGVGSPELVWRRHRRAGTRRDKKSISYLMRGTNCLFSTRAVDRQGPHPNRRGMIRRHKSGLRDRYKEFNEDPTSSISGKKRFRVI